MRIAIAGYGKMGKMIHSLCGKGTEAVSIIDPASDSPSVTSRRLTVRSLEGCDAVIDFSSPDSIMENIAMYAEGSATAVIGTTGWHDRLDEVRRLLQGTSARLLYSANFSLGVAIFLMLAETAGRLIDDIDSYDIAVCEAHHSAKADSPSGTALMAGERILAAVGRKKRILSGNSDGRIAPDQLQISSVRVGSVPGTHSIMIDGPSDTITITHQARDRKGFAEGALQAARWLLGQPAGLYSMDDFAASLIGGGSNA